MELLESQWFFQMVESQGKTPTEKLIAVFKVAATWIAAPGMREQFRQENPSNRNSLYAHTQLKNFLTEMAALAKASNPTMLANQLVILLQGAIAEELRNPGMRAMEGAMQAAQAVVSVSCQAPRRKQIIRWSTGALAATVLASALGWHVLMLPGVSPASPTLLAQSLPPATANPDTIEKVLVLQEQIAKGVCPAPQLLALPPGQITAYMNVVNFHTSDNPAADQENIRAFLTWYANARARECYIPPANGHTAVKWVKG